MPPAVGHLFPSRTRTMNAAQICTLFDAPAGTRVRVRGVAGQRGMRSRLCALGITPGTEVEVCDECNCHGSRRIKVRDAALVLCASVAQSVLCECTCLAGEAQRTAPEHLCRGTCTEDETAIIVCCDDALENNEQPARLTCKNRGAPQRGRFRHRGR